MGENSIVVTDASAMYTPIAETHRHEVVNHAQDEYVRGEFHTNSIEGFWSLLKRGIIGIYHNVSPKHLGSYCDEFSYRYNTRTLTDTDRFEYVLTHSEGRLTYEDLKNKGKK